ncbi:MAG: SDR family oxidoreductase [Fulvivirga sp.]|uniref:SDR family oxidoreductase n=1 Tax=Fulvivirga sp. TaxID=1931237 RepID=UPI0032EB6AD7
MKTIFITGASSGIGRSIVEYFQDKGWNVAATMRTPDEHADLKSLKNVNLYQLDVLNEASIKMAITDAIADFGRIDVLVNNAGYALVGAFEASTNEQIRRQFDTNVFGLMNVTRAILPHFRKNKNGTIINVASVGGRITFPLYSLYHGTKWAVEGFSESLQYELRQFGIKVRIIEPGAIKTDFYDRSMDLMKADGLEEYDNYVNGTFNTMQKVGAKAPGPIVVAKKVYKAATQKNYKMRYPVGSGAPFLLFLRRVVPNSWFFAMVRMVTEKNEK